jgi:hypothetical protein
MNKEQARTKTGTGSSNHGKNNTKLQGKKKRQGRLVRSSETNEIPLVQYGGSQRIKMKGLAVAAIFFFSPFLLHSFIHHMQRSEN